MVVREDIVIALGGNALIQNAQRGSFEEQYSNVKMVAKQIIDVVQEGYRVILTHGNGPQVGAALLRHEMSSEFVPSFPLHACNAETQGLIGYMIVQALQDEIYRRKLDKSVVSIITRVLVNGDDHAFTNPTKPIGQFLEKQQIDLLKLDNSSLAKRYQENGNGKFKRLVPSPKPLAILEIKAIKALVDADFMVIACGGGGIPVIDKGESKVGVDAVIDKDLASEKLATQMHANKLILLTDAEGLYADWGKSTQRVIPQVIVNHESSIDLANLAEGSIRPKVQACINFVKQGGNEAIIASLGRLTDALNGLSGTHFTP